MALPVLPKEIRSISLELADRLAPELRDRFLAVIAVAAQAVPLAELQSLLERGAFAEINRRFEIALASSLSSTAYTQFLDTKTSLFRRSLTAAGAAIAVQGGFNVVSAAVEILLREDAGRLILGITHDSLVSVRHTMSRAYLEGIGSRAAARLLRDSIGLLPRHAAARDRYAEGLRLQGYSEDRVIALTATYSRRLLNWRAEAIARTEAATAVHAAQLVKWEDWVRDGILQPERTHLEWMTTKDDRLCPICAPMDGQRVRFGEHFVSDEISDTVPYRRGKTLAPDPLTRTRNARGQFSKRAKVVDTVPHPPLHPQCRCSMVLRFDEEG